MKEKVAEKIRMKRLQMNFSQQNMADELGITAAAYSNLERGVTEISLSRLFQIANLLNQEPSWFLNESSSIEEKIDFEQDISSKGITQQVYMLIQEVQQLKAHIKKIDIQLGNS